MWPSMTDLIEVLNEHDYPVDSAQLVRAAQVVLAGDAASQAAQSGLTIVIEDDEAVTALNLRYRQIDAPTDVLSFPADVPPLPPGVASAMNDGAGDETGGEPTYLGDLVIAYPYAAAQAAREGHALADTFVLLVVHGVLHLLGYDHDTPENRAAMWAAQADALVKMGVSPAIVPALEGGEAE